MPLRMALRNTRLRPIAASRPGGQITKISHNSSAAARIVINAHAGWRSMNLLMQDPRPQRFAGHPPMPQCPRPVLPLTYILPRRDRLRDRVRDILTGPVGPDLIESIIYRFRATLLRDAIPWRHGGNQSAPSPHWRRRRG